jgi:hypothetical protein
MRRILYLSISYRYKNLTENVDLLKSGKDAIMNKNFKAAEDALRKWMKLEKDNSIKGLQAELVLGVGPTPSTTINQIP